MDEVARLGNSYDVRFLPDARIAVIAGSRRISILGLPSGEPISSAAFPNPSALAVVRRESRLAAVSTSGASVLLDSETLEEVAHSSGRGIGEGPELVAGPDGAEYVQASWRGDLIVRNAETGEAIYRERDAGTQIGSIAASPSGAHLAYAVSRDQSEALVVRPWPIADHAPTTVWEATGPALGVNAISLRDDGIAAAIFHDRISVFSVADGRLLADRAWQFPGTDFALAWHPDGCELAAIEEGPDGHRLILLTPDLTEIANAPIAYACSVSYSKDGDLIAVGSWESGRVLQR
jgi:hypothetical protein